MLHVLKCSVLFGDVFFLVFFRGGGVCFAGLLGVFRKGFFALSLTNDKQGLLAHHKLA